MTSLEGTYPAPPDVDHVAAGKEYHYELRLEIGLEDSVEGIAINAVFAEFVRQMTLAAGHDVTVTDVKDRAMNLDNPPDGEDFKRNFCVEVIEAKKRKIFLGFKLTTVTPMSTLKHRMFAYLRERQMFLRVHTGGYTHGMNSALLGYLSEENPNTADIAAWHETLHKEIHAAWKTPGVIDDDIRKQIIQKFPGQATKHKVSFPINIEKGNLVAIHSNKKKIQTVGLIITTPKQFIEPVKQLMDGILLSTKKIPCLVPSALKKEDSDMYYTVLAKHAKYVYHHRNVRIQDIFPPTFDKEIKPVLKQNPKILRIYVDKARSRANISTMAEDYLAVCGWIDNQLARLQLSYVPTRMQRNPGSIMTGKSVATKYSQLFKDDQTIQSDASSFDPSTIKTSRSNAWQTRLPIKIAYTVNADAFPPLKKTDNPAPATITDLTENSSNIDDLIVQAVKKVEEDNAKKLEEVTSAMQARMDALEKSISTIIAKVVEATYNSLTSAGTFVTKEENLALQSEVMVMTKKIDAILEALHTQRTLEVSSPPRKNQRVNEGTDQHQSSAPLISDTAMSERED